METASNKAERETSRLAALERLDTVRHETDLVLQELVDEVREAFGTDLCMVSLILSDAQYFRAWSGDLPSDLAEAGQDPRERSMCRHVVENEAPFVVEDFLATEEFRDQHFRVNYGVRFYAGAPLVTSGGNAIGSLCLLDTRPRGFGEGELALLKAFAKAVMGRLELLGALERERRQGELHETLLDALGEVGEGLVLTEGERIVHANEAFCRISGYGADELCAMPSFFALVPPEERTAVGEHLRGCLEDQPVEDHAETTILHKSGRRICVEVGVKVLRTEGRDGLVVVARDVTGRKLSEKEVRFQARLLDAVGQAVIATDLSGKIVYWNRAAEALYGWSAEEAVDRNILETVVSEETREQAEEIMACLMAGEGWSGEFVVRRRDGSGFPAFVHDTPVFDEGGELVGVIGVSHDITERKRAEEARRESEERFRMLFDRSADALLVHDEEGRVLDCNSEACRTLGYAREELLALRVKDFAGGLLSEEEKRERENAGGTPWQRATRGEPEASGIVHYGEHKRKDGTSFPVEVRFGSVEYGGRRTILASVRDITERKGAEEALRRSEERFRSLVQNASDLITVVEVDGTILYESPSIERILGYAPENLIKSNALDFVHPDDRPQVLRAFARLAEERGANPYVEYRFRHVDGSWRHIESSGTNLLDEPSVGGIVVNSRDVTERKLLEERLLHQALHDPLTGLPNRALFMDRLTHALERARRRDAGSVAVMFLDLDDFKIVNDSMGHEAGDRLLVEAAGRLRACLRPEDTLARLGGDEFVVLLEDVGGRGEATEVAARVAEALREPFSLGAHEEEVFVSASVGIALGAAAEDRPAGVPEELLRRADMAMYEAKRKGKAHHEVFEPRMNAPALERLRVGTDLRRAVERGEFRVHYQPEVSLRTGRAVGFEALVRWEHPEHGLVSPARFIPVAEETGMIVPIGRWVLEEACRRAKEWREQRAQVPPSVMSVNLSARQFGHPDLVRDVAHALGETGLDPGCLVLEITESVVMDDAVSTIDTLDELKALGVRLAIDDFGTGYSSLSYLKRFPVDFLKVDRSFVDGLGEDPEDTVLVSGIVDLAHALGLKVVAEGVETEDQLEVLRKMGCDLAQGYRFARPLPGERAGTLLQKARLP